MTNIWMQLLHMLRSLWPSQQRSRMYWLLRHAQNARDINIHKLHHPLPEKNRLGPCRFSAHGTGYIEIAVFVLWLVFVDFSQNFWERPLLVLKKFNHDFTDETRHSEIGYIEIVVFVPCRLQSRFQSVEHPFKVLSKGMFHCAENRDWNRD